MKSTQRQNLSKLILKCSKCNKLLPKREFMTCSKCKLSYDLKCANVSVQRFNNTMTPNHKSAWKCMTCVETRNEKNVVSKTLNKPEQSTEPNSPVIMETSVDKQNQNIYSSEFMNCNDNITIRQNTKINVSTHNSFQSLSTEDEEDLSSVLASQSKTGFNRSCPEINAVLNVREELDSIKIELKDTQNKLLIAENEIDNMLIENSKLQKQITQYELKIKKMTRICTTTDLNISKNNYTPDNRTTSSLTSTLQKKKKRDQNHTSTPKYSKKNTQSQMSGKKLEQIKNIIENKTQNNTMKNKVCVLSTNNTNKLLSISKKIIGDDFELCHYIKPKCGILEILHGINAKVKNFTMKDYCVIMMGHEDFRSTLDYYDLINKIKYILQEISHTNVLLCLPVFKCGRYYNSVMNWRIESFNKVLYDDRHKHENYPCKIVDSNFHLRYDDSMFNRRTGLLKNYGMTIIFKQIYEMMCSIIIEESCNVQSQTIEDENWFFL